MPRIVINVDAKVHTLPECVKLKPTKNYVDAIEKDHAYIDINQVQITVVNSCNKLFSVDGFTLFTDTSGNGDFKAQVNAFTLAPYQELNVPVYYNGTYRGSDTQRVHNISLNGSTATYTLNITVPEVNHPPVLSDINILRDNRQNYIFTLADFENHYQDPDMDAMSSIILIGDLTNFRLNGNTITSGVEVSKYQIENEMLSYLAPNTDNETSIVLQWEAKDSRGLISNN